MRSLGVDAYRQLPRSVRDRIDAWVKVAVGVDVHRVPVYDLALLPGGRVKVSCIATRDGMPGRPMALNPVTGEARRAYIVRRYLSPPPPALVKASGLPAL